MSNDKNNKKIYLALVIILIGGLVLRIHNLSYQSIWLDEAFSIYHGQKSLVSILDLKDPSPPLYYALLHFWMKFFGTSETGVRLLSVFFGTASILFIFLLGTTIFNAKAGIYSALLLAFSPLHIYFSQEARTYSLLFTLMLLSMYFYYEMNKAASKWSITGYLISTILLAYSHFYAIFIIIAQDLHQFLVNRFRLSKKFRRWILIQIFIFIFYIPWIGQLPSIISKEYHSWIPKPTVMELAFMTYDFFSGRVFSYYGLALTMLCLVLIMRYRSAREKSALFIIWVLVPVLIPFIYSLIFTPIFTPKYVYLVSLPLYIMISWSLVSMKTRHRPAFILLLIFLSSATIYVQQNTVTKDTWREVAKYIQDNHHEDDKIIIINSYEVLPFLYYFDKMCFMSNDIYSCSRVNNVYPIDTTEEAMAISGNSFWLIVTRDAYNEEAREVTSHFDKSYNKTGSKEYQLGLGPGLFGSVYYILDEMGIIPLKFNRIMISHFQNQV